MKILQTKWMATIIGVVLYCAVTWFCLQPSKIVEERQRQLNAVVEAELQKVQPSWAFKNPELDQALAEIKMERDALHQRQLQLDELEKRLAIERAEIYSATQAVFKLQTELDRVVLRIKDDEVTNVKKLSKIYTAMAPENAARIFKEMEDEQVVKILAMMKEGETSVILENMGAGDREAAKRAATISNRLRLTVGRSNAETKPKTP
jgi:flagellar motility protein MotE (MotC chaperone)